jgi:hypothetical protein
MLVNAGQRGNESLAVALVQLVQSSHGVVRDSFGSKAGRERSLRAFGIDSTIALCMGVLCFL